MIETNNEMLLNHKGLLKFDHSRDDKKVKEYFDTIFEYDYDLEEKPLIKLYSKDYILIDLQQWKVRDLPKEWLWKLIVDTSNRSLNRRDREKVDDMQKDKLQEVVTECIHEKSCFYCLVDGSYFRLMQVMSLMSFRKTQEPLIINIDGPAGSGKTTLANQFYAITNSSIIHMDDFFLPQALRTEKRLAEPGGNVHYERFKDEVLKSLRLGIDFSYRKFDCKQMDYGQNNLVKARSLIIVEGSYSGHPKFENYSDLKVFCDIDPLEQKKRIEKRNGKDMLKVFESKWIPMENLYIKSYKIKDESDIII